MADAFEGSFTVVVSNWATRINSIEELGGLVRCYSGSYCFEFVS